MSEGPEEDDVLSTSGSSFIMADNEGQSPKQTTQSNFDEAVDAAPDDVLFASGPSRPDESYVALSPTPLRDSGKSNARRASPNPGEQVPDQDDLHENAILSKATRRESLQAKLLDLQVEVWNIRRELGITDSSNAREESTLSQGAEYSADATNTHPSFGNSTRESSGAGPAHEELEKLRNLVREQEEKLKHLKQENDEYRDNFDKIPQSLSNDDVNTIEAERLRAQLKTQEEEIHQLRTAIDSLAGTRLGDSEGAQMLLSQKDAALRDLEGTISGMRTEASKLISDLRLRTLEISTLKKEKEKLRDLLEQRRPEELRRTASFRQMLYRIRSIAREQSRKLRNERRIKAQIASMLEEQLDRNDKQAEIIEPMREEQQRLKSTVEELAKALEKSAADLVSEKKAFTDIAADLKAKANSRDTHVKMLEQSIENYKTELQGLSHLNAEIREERSRLQRDLSSVQSQFDSLTVRFESQAAGTLKKDQDLLEAKARISELEAENHRISELLISMSPDFKNAQAEVTLLRERISELSAEKGSIERQLELISERYDELRSTSSQHSIQLQSDISDLNTQMASQKSKMDEMRKSLEAEITTLKSTHARDISTMRQSRDAEVKQLQDEKTHVELLLNSDKVNLELEINDLKSRLEALSLERKTLLHREKKEESLKLDLKAALETMKDELSSSQEKLRQASLEAKWYQSKLEDANVSISALTEANTKYERLVATKTRELDEASSENVPTLKRLAEEGSEAVKEISQLRSEYAQQSLQWQTAQHSLTTELQQALSDKAKLEEQLQAFRSHESQREAQMRANVEAGYQAVLASQQQDHQQVINLMTSALAQAENESKQLRESLLAAQSSQRNLEFSVKAKELELEKLSTTVRADEMDGDSLRADLDSIRIERSRLLAALDEANSRASQLEAKYDEAVKDLETQEKSLLSFEQHNKDRQRLIETMQQDIHVRDQLFRDNSRDLFTILFAYQRRIRDLIFVKIYLTKYFPDKGSIRRKLLDHRTPAQRLQDAFLFALAVVKFKSAARDKTMEKASQSERRILYN